MPYGIKLKVWGDFACFTRPEMKVERVSYDVMTPSAARGILEGIYWKPAIRWVIDRIHVLNPIRFMNIRRNEVASKIPLKKVKAAMKNGRTPLEIFVDDVKQRQQRAAMILRNVSYVIEAHFEYTSKEDNNDGKHLDEFNRRARKGKCFNQPYLGCREFPAHFRLLEADEPLPASRLRGTQNLGYMLCDIDFQKDTHDAVVNMQPYFFPAVMKDGIITLNKEEIKA
ncbi:MAG: type I-C CRISPR-associated protein Cas5 [Planctomycetota bacterium]|nr:MAG: type I-C CRISPR-associated protein Cas5 [Planctomycetota bacterium]